MEVREECTKDSKAQHKFWFDKAALNNENNEASPSQSSYILLPSQDHLSVSLSRPLICTPSLLSQAVPVCQDVWNLNNIIKSANKISPVEE